MMCDFEKEFATLLGEDISDIFSELDTSTDEPLEGTQYIFDDVFDLTAGINTNVDLVLCIDVTASMKPIIDTIKGMAPNFYDDMVAASAKYIKKVNRFRVKVITFRDYYCDDKNAMAESQFFNLPDESAAFSEYVLSLKAKGGGDESKNALEAIALAMKSDWVHAVSPNEKARNIIVVFTDAAAYSFEKVQDGVTKFYPDGMLTSLEDLKMAWEGQNRLDGAGMIDKYMMDPQAKRLIIYSPLDLYPWNEVAFLTNVKTSSIEPAKGGQELDRQTFLDDIISGFY